MFLGENEDLLKYSDLSIFRRTAYSFHRNDTFLNGLSDSSLGIFNVALLSVVVTAHIFSCWGVLGHIR